MGDGLLNTSFIFEGASHYSGGMTVLAYIDNDHVPVFHFLCVLTKTNSLLPF